MTDYQWVTPAEGGRPAPKSLTVNKLGPPAPGGERKSLILSDLRF